MEEKIRQICNELCCKEIPEDENLIASGLLDSFKIMELICSLEEEFHITFLPEEMQDLDNFSCLKCIWDIVKQKTKQTE